MGIVQLQQCQDSGTTLGSVVFVINTDPVSDWVETDCIVLMDNTTWNDDQ